MADREMEKDEQGMKKPAGDDMVGRADEQDSDFEDVDELDGDADEDVDEVEE